MSKENEAREVTPFTMFGPGSPKQQGNIKDFTPIEQYDRPNFPAPTPLPTPEQITTEEEQSGKATDDPPANAPESTDGSGGATDDDLSWLENDAPEV